MMAFYGITLAVLAALVVVSAGMIIEMDAFAQTTGSLADVVDTARTTSPTTIEITFTRDVNNISQGDFTVNGATALPGPEVSVTVGNTLMLILPEDAKLDSGARPTISIASGASFTSGFGVGFVTYNVGSISADDGISPQIKTGKISGPNSVTIIYDEPVRAGITDYVGLEIGPVTGFNVNSGGKPVPPKPGSGTARNITDIQGSGTEEHTITFLGIEAMTDFGGQITIQPNVKDTSGNVLFNAAGTATITSPRMLGLGDGQPAEIISVLVTEKNVITIKWSEDMQLPRDGTAKLQELFSKISLVGVSGDPIVSSSIPETGKKGSHILTLKVGTQALDAPVDAQGIITIGEMADPSGNKTPRMPNLPVYDGQKPSLKKDSGGVNDIPIRITGPNEITMISDEAVYADEETFYNLKIDHDGDGTTTIQDREVTGVTGVSSDTLVITFGGEPASTSATGTISIKDTLTDLNDNPHSSVTKTGDPTRELADGQAPAIQGEAKIAYPDRAVIEFTENIQSGYSLTNLSVQGIGAIQDSSIMKVQSDSRTIRLDFPGTAAASSGGHIDVSGIKDIAGNEMPASRIQLVPGQIPTILSARITGDGEITVKFSEKVVEDGISDIANAFSNLRFTGQEDVQRRIISASGSGTDTFRVKFLVPESTSTPTDATATMDVSNLKDMDNTESEKYQDNPLASVTRLAVVDGMPPAIKSAVISGPNEATIIFSEDVDAERSDFDRMGITGESATRSITYFEKTAGNTIRLEFGGSAAISSDTGHITISSGVTDVSPWSNPYVPGTSQPLKDGQRPTLESIAITGGNEITAVFSEPVKEGVLDGGKADGFSAFRILPNDHRDITVDANRSITERMVVEFTGDAAPPGSSGTITITDSIEDKAGNGFAGRKNQPVAAGQAPLAMSASFTGPDTVMVTFSEAIALPDGADHFTGLSIDGGPVSGDIISASKSGEGKTATLKFSGDKAKSGSIGTMNISGVTDTDSNPNPMSPVTGMVVSDGQSPMLNLLAVTGPNVITAEFSEPVRAAETDFDRLRLQGESKVREITDIIRSGSETIYITFDGPSTRTDAKGKIVISSELSDTASDRNQYEPEFVNGIIQPKDIKDGQSPKLLRAEFHDKRGIKVAYSEVVTAPEGSYTYLNFGTESRDFVESAHNGDVHTLMYDGAAVDAPTATMIVSRSIADESKNPVILSSRTVAVETGGKPEILSASITAADKITVIFSEPIRAEKRHFSFTQAGAGAPKAIQELQGSGTDTIVLVFGKRSFSSGITGTMEVTDGVADLFGNKIKTVSGLRVSPMQSQSVQSALLTGPNQITITFTGNVSAGLTNFENLVIISGSQRQDRNVTGVEGSGTERIVVTFDGSRAPTGATAVIDVIGITGAGRNAADALRNITVGDGQAPRLVSVSISSSNQDAGTATAGDTITLAFTASEPIPSPTVSISNSTVTVLNTSGDSWNAAREVTAEDPTGTVAFLIEYEDLAGNPGEDAAATTDGTMVSVADQPIPDAAVIRGVVFSDVNGDGTRDAGEEGIVGYNSIFIVPPANSGLVYDGNPYRSTPTGVNGTYRFDNVTPGIEWVIQTTYFPPRHTVLNEASSWFTRVTPVVNQTVTFNVGFHLVPPEDLVTLDLFAYNDLNRDGSRGAGEDGIPGLRFETFTYSTRETLNLTTESNGRVSTSEILPANWALSKFPEGWAVTSIDYQRYDNTDGKQYNNTSIVVDRPEKGSRHAMTFGMWQMP